jgi:hypothetical protein
LDALKWQDGCKQYSVIGGWWSVIGGLMQSRLYSVNDLNFSPLLAELENFFHVQGHQVQTLAVGSGHVVQAQKETTLSAITGQSSALTIKIMPEPNGTRVEIGSSKWIDKAAIGLVGYVIMPVLAIIPLIGFYNQYKLGEDAWRIVNSFMSRHQSQSGSPPPHGWASQQQSSSLNCPSCGSFLAPQVSFCSSCGSQVSAMPVCKKCGTTNQRGARFCSGCGEKFSDQ